MKSRNRYFLLLILTVLAALILAGCSGSGAPRIGVIPASHDFGQVGPEPVTTVFSVRNEGSGPLRIESVTTSCGCTTAQLSADSIAPGQTADLTVTFDPQAHPGATGEFVRFVYLRTNDPQAAEVEVQITATVPDNPVSEEVSQ